MRCASSWCRSRYWKAYDACKGRMTELTMTSRLFASGFLQLHPGLCLLRMGVLSAAPGGMPDEETLKMMSGQVEKGALAGIAGVKVWNELACGLMSAVPSNMFRALYACGALASVLPEVEALFGVPQVADDPQQVDVGLHLMRVLDEAARCNAPLPVRFAAMAMHLGKSDSPPEHLPVHYRHVERGRPRIEAMCKRFGLSAECRDMAMLALAECEPVHRVSEIRAGPVAALLERLGAFDNTKRYKWLMLLCACDYRAYPGRRTQEYPKARLLDIALTACAGVDETGLAPDALKQARAKAIATAFGSERWSVSS